MAFLSQIEHLEVEATNISKECQVCHVTGTTSCIILVLDFKRPKNCMCV